MQLFFMSWQLWLFRGCSSFSPVIWMGLTNTVWATYLATVRGAISSSTWTPAAGLRLPGNTFKWLSATIKKTFFIGSGVVDTLPFRGDRGRKQSSLQSFFLLVDVDFLHQMPRSPFAHLWLTYSNTIVLEQVNKCCTATQYKPFSCLSLQFS